jgi:putative CocE/NonD family hydrolase
MAHPPRSVVRPVALLALALLVLPSTPLSQGLDFIKATYTKYEFQIPMRDEVRLFTAVYVPKDQSQTYPVLLNRTPYGIAPYGVDNYPASLGPSELFARDLYIFVNQDVRGRMMSEGDFVNMRPHLPVKKGPKDIDESSDTYDTIDWLVKNVPNNNGRVGIYGISYPGFYSSAGMIDAHPALKAASPQAPISDWFIGDDFHHNGALFLPHAFNFFAIFGHPRPAPTTGGFGRFDPGTADGYRFFLDLGPMPNVNTKFFKGDIAFWTEMMQHETYDAFWQARNLRPHLKNVKPAVMTVGGWFDAEDLFGALETYKWTEKQSPGASNVLVMGPWSHGGWARNDGDGLGDVRFAFKASLFYREKIELPFFSFYLKGKSDPALPEAYVFETGRNQWRTFDAWPPRAAAPRALYFRGDGRLSFEPPTEDAAQAYDEYISDPARPVPYINSVAIGMTREYMVDDQRFAAERPDVLVYETDELTDDVTIAGPIAASLQVATSGTDSDWIVKLIDVYPSAYPDPVPVTGPVNPFMATYSKMGGYQQLVRGEPMRGKFRNSFERPEPFEPNKIAKVEYTMPDVFHTFRRGHRIMVQVQSTWFPLVNLNPQTFVSINAAKPADFRKASQRVYRSKSQSSKVTVLVLQ